MKATLRCLILVILSKAGMARAVEPMAQERWWPDTTEQAVERAGGHRSELIRALQGAQGTAQREGMRFLVENMPERDLQTLSADFLLENVALAVEARAQAPWGQTVPDDVFLDQILPYANASEGREAWREAMRARCLPLVEGCTTPGQAAQRLNETLFPLVKVRYSTGRAKADQSPAESMASGVASCTGLSILLVDACRSVGVPARMVGIPDWVDGRGNHTWVEVWDAGTWHFLGAAEPDKRGLDHAWFERDAALAQADSPRHAIYAVSFRRTGLAFPIAWGPDTGGVDAENVTAHYTGDTKKITPDPARETARVMVRVRERRDGPRVAAAINVRGVIDPTKTKTGTSKGEGADTNDLLSFDLPHGQDFDLGVEYGRQSTRRKFTVGTDATQLLEVVLAEGSHDKSAGLEMSASLADFFAASPAQRATWKFDLALDAALTKDPALVRRLAWEVYLRTAIHPEVRVDFAANRVRSGEYVSPYTLRKVGEKPAAGWGLVIAMHGGGGAPKEVNDSQWQGMQTYYRDHPEAGGGYLYVALRAPNDTWNGFYDDYVYPLVDKLIRQIALNEAIDPDRVYLIGYSHGGYGAFAIGPKLPDHFAAIHSSAAAPTDGLISPKTLRNTPFDFAVGEFDDAYGRRERCEAFDRAVRELRGVRTDIFPVTFSLVAGRHHGDLPDHDQLREMLPLKRQPAPRELTWEQTDDVIYSFYWLMDPAPAKGHEIDAACRDNRLVISTHRGVARFSVLLDERLVDFDRPVVVEHDGREERLSVQPKIAALSRTLLERGDPALAFSCRIDFTTGDDGELRAAVATWP